MFAQNPINRRYRLIGVVVVLVAVVAAGGWLAWRMLAPPVAASVEAAGGKDRAGAQSRPSAPQPPAAQPLAARWDCLAPVNARLAWTVVIKSTYTVNPSVLLGPSAEAQPGATGGQRRGERTLRGVLRARVEPGTSGGRSLIVALTEAVVHDDGRVSAATTWAQMATPIAVDQAADCGIVRFGFGPATGVAARNEWRLLLGLLDVRAGQQPSHWEARHRDPTGTHIADYHLTAFASGGDPVQAVVRRRKDYESVAGPPGAAPLLALIDASYVIVTARPGGGIASWDGTESVRLQTATGRLFVATKTAIDVQQTPAGPDDLALAARLTWRTPGPLEPVGADPHFDVPPGAPPPTFVDALASFSRWIAAGKLRLALGVLVPWLRAHPGAADELIAALLANELPADARAAAFLALELAETSQSQRALVAALRDSTMPDADRSRAAAALQGVRKPAGSTIDGLLLATANAGDGDEAASAALLAVGTLAGRSDVTESDRARLHERLEHALKASGADAKVVALGAIGNSADPERAATVTPLVDADEPTVRAAALGALNKIGRPLTLQAVLSKLAADPAGNVQSALATHLDMHNEPPLDALAATTKLLANNNLPLDTRLALARLMVRLAGRFDGAKSALEQQIAVELDGQVLRALGGKP